MNRRKLNRILAGLRALQTDNPGCAELGAVIASLSRLDHRWSQRRALESQIGKNAVSSLLAELENSR